ncbi:hypothetical protein HJG60_011037 [Phyllostomus discolor]|uniref:Uncharacterized protein n=1 Tax=Phyllostomus discolor TaxID=89673 RepID=A0A834AHK2_9CHIR|nr:hypothetical protein HJG60_011037 [Phyllostomus discolor]
MFHVSILQSPPQGSTTHRGGNPPEHSPWKPVQFECSGLIEFLDLNAWTSATMREGRVRGGSASPSAVKANPSLEPRRCTSTDAAGRGSRERFESPTPAAGGRQPLEVPSPASASEEHASPSHRVLSHRHISKKLVSSPGTNCPVGRQVDAPLV